MKDYYISLGVHRSAEEIVIKRAYQALAQKYHPDRVPGSEKESATKKMKELNEAKDVLLDPEKRNKYNKLYDAKNIDGKNYESSFSEQEQEQEQEQFSKSSTKDDEWNIAVSHYSDLKKIIKELSLISPKLSNLYKKRMLESKEFGERRKIREVMENEHLTKFYGDDEKTRAYVKSLLLNNFKQAAIEVNKHVLVMGNSIKYQQIYPKIEKQFPDAKVCRLKPALKSKPAPKPKPVPKPQIKIQELKLRRIDDPYLNDFISRLEINDIFPTDVCILFSAIFNTDVKPEGDTDSRTYSYMIDGRRYNLDINYLKRKLVETLSITN